MLSNEQEPLNSRSGKLPAGEQPATSVQSGNEHDAFQEKSPLVLSADTPVLPFSGLTELYDLLAAGSGMHSVPVSLLGFEGDLIITPNRAGGDFQLLLGMIIAKNADISILQRYVMAVQSPLGVLYFDFTDSLIQEEITTAEDDDVDITLVLTRTLYDFPSSQAYFTQEMLRKCEFRLCERSSLPVSTELTTTEKFKPFESINLRDATIDFFEYDEHVEVARLPITIAGVEGTLILQTIPEVLSRMYNVITVTETLSVVFAVVAGKTKIESLPLSLELELTFRSVDELLRVQNTVVEVRFADPHYNDRVFYLDAVRSEELAALTRSLAEEENPDDTRSFSIACDSNGNELILPWDEAVLKTIVVRVIDRSMLGKIVEDL